MSSIQTKLRATYLLNACPFNGAPVTLFEVVTLSSVVIPIMDPLLRSVSAITFNAIMVGVQKTLAPCGVCISSSLRWKNQNMTG